MDKAYISEEHAKSLSRHNARPGDVLIAAMGDVLPRVCLVPRGIDCAIVKADCFRLRAREGMLPKYLAYMLSAPQTRKLASSQIAGVGRPRLNLKKVSALTIPVPPEQDQERIVVAIEEQFSRLDVAVEALLSGQKRAISIKKAILLAAVPEVWSKRWRKVTVAQAGEVALGRQRAPQYHNGPKMRQYLRVANVFEDRIDSRDVMSMHFDDEEFERFRLRPEDILLNEGQSPHLLGRPAMYRGDPPDVAFTNSLLRFRAGPDVLPAWALLVFRRHMHAKRFMDESQITTNIAHLSAGRFKKVEFPIPPMDEQKLIVAAIEEKLSEVSRMEDVVNAQLVRADRLRSSILAAAFSGQLVSRDKQRERQRDHRSEAVELLQRPAGRRALVSGLLEQLTFLLFLKMADEQTRPPFSRPAIVPAGARLGVAACGSTGTAWRRSTGTSWTELGKQPGTLGVIFRKAQNRIQDPAKLRRLIVDLIDREQWMTLDADVKGDAYEGLLAKNAEDVKSGAGQYFTPRPLIQAIVDVMRPTPAMRSATRRRHRRVPARAPIERMKAGPLDPDQKRFLRDEAFRGWEIVDTTARLCAMNLLLHGIGAPESPSVDHRGRLAALSAGRALRDGADQPAVRPEVVLQVINAEGEAEREDMSYLRDDFWATTSNKQLNFLQHVKIAAARSTAGPPSSCRTTCCSRAAPARRSGASCCTSATCTRCCACRPASSTRSGVKANVLFFDRKPPSEKPWTNKLWIYDFRTNQHFTLKTSAAERADLDDFVACYNPDNRHERDETERFRAFTYDELVARDKASSTSSGCATSRWRTPTTCPPPR